MSETVSAAGELARLAVKNGTSQPLQSAITNFVSSEKIIANTDEMLRKINEGMMDLVRKHHPRCPAFLPPARAPLTPPADAKIETSSCPHAFRRRV